jgi:hypothetical protein
MTRHHGQDLSGLFGGEARLVGEQLLGVGQRHVESSHGFGPARHPGFPCFDTTTDE